MEFDPLRESTEHPICSVRIMSTSVTGASGRLAAEKYIMTTLKGNTTLVRETNAVYRGKALVVELRAFSMRLRLKGARYRYELDYLALFQLGARKEAERLRTERERLRVQRAKRR